MFPSSRRARAPSRPRPPRRRPPPTLLPARGDEARPEPAAHPEQEMTAQQLRDAIEAKGGFAPKKANKQQLAELLEAL